MLSDAQAAELSLLVLYAMDQYQADRASLCPTPDARLSPNWRVLGYLTAQDCLFRRGQTVVPGDETCYGYLAQQITNPTVFVAAIRGTDGILEWIEDGEFVPIAHPVAGLVEQGFFSIYQSMQYRPIGGTPVPAADGISQAVGSRELIILGHSLGSALATYLTFDVASELDTRVQAILFASPRPGNAAFVRAFAARVVNSVVYNYELDVVPRVPVGPDYTDLTTVHWIGIEAAQARIGLNLACHHHIVCYAAMLNFALANWGQFSIIDQTCTACIKGPSQ